MGTTINCPEIRTDFSLTPLERAQARDSYVREWVRQVQNWTEIARVCLSIKIDQDWKVLGFHSWEAWLMSAAPEERSRSYLYAIVRTYASLSASMPEDDLEGVKLGSAGILQGVSSEIRRDPRILAAAKDKPERLREVLERDFPEQHIETTVNKRCRFPRSMWEETIKPKFDAYLVSDPTASFESFIEFLCTEQA